MIRTLIRWPGNKFRSRNRILDLIPDHKKYIEACAGSAAIALNKEKCSKQVISDLNPTLCNLYEVVKNQSKELVELINQTPYCKESYNLADSMREREGEGVYGALIFLIRNRMSFMAYGKSFDDRLRSPWQYLPFRIETASKKLQDYEICCRSVFDQVRYARKDTFLYLDPPYLQSERTVQNLYDFEMDLHDHLRLLDLIRLSKAKIAISGVDSKIYSKNLTNWHCSKWQTKVAYGTVKNREKASYVECLWRNYG